MFETQEKVVKGRDMAVPSDAEAAAEATRLGDMRKKVEFKLSRLKPEKITLSQIASAKKKLDDILDLSEEYGIGMTALLEKYATMEESFRLQYQADLDNLLQKVDDIVEAVFDNVCLLEKTLPAVAQPGNSLPADQLPLAVDMLDGV